MGKRDIADFFEENLEGSYKKTKAIYSIYSMLSDYGTHRLEGTVEVAKNEDNASTHFDFCITYLYSVCCDLLCLQ